VALDGFRPLAMRGPNDCGPTAMLQALRHLGSDTTYEELLRVWRFREGADRTDTPGHHLLALRRLGVPVSMRRRLGRARIVRALSEGRPVVMLVPTGVVRWHWVVACGLEGSHDDGDPVISPGDGSVLKTGWAELALRARSRPEGRPLRVDGLGYCVGAPRAFEPDVALERDLVRLAKVAEGALAPVEPIARAARRLAAKIGWKNAGPGGNLCPGTSRETGR
jgi:hypothetical protein